jgi:hypothetical protein
MGLTEVEAELLPKLTPHARRLDVVRDRLGLSRA